MNILIVILAILLIMYIAQCIITYQQAKLIKSYKKSTEFYHSDDWRRR